MKERRDSGREGRIRFGRKRMRRERLRRERLICSGRFRGRRWRY